MKTYVDSGVLVKLYSWEALSEAAVKLVADLPSVPLTPLHELEIRNALRAQRGRGLISQKQLKGEGCGDYPKYVPVGRRQ